MPRSIILLSDVPGLGQLGDKCTVKDGYARNYLIPQKLAIIATPNALKHFERQKEKLAKQREDQMTKAREIGADVSKIGLVFERPVGQGGRLFGSVTSFDIAEELVKQGATLDKKSILMHGPIKTAGDHTIRVRIHSQVTVDIPVKVIGLEAKKEAAEAEQQEQPES